VAGVAGSPPAGAGRVVTAFAVQMTQGSLIAWIAPTVVGTVIIARANRRELARQAPAQARDQGVPVA
jgi:hypothetical protein